MYKKIESKIEFVDAENKEFDKTCVTCDQTLAQLDVGACPGVNYLEHVQARLSLSAARRGDLRIALTSPAGTKVTLLAPR